MEEFIKTHMSLLDSIDIVVNDSEAKKRLENLLDGIDGIYVTSSVKQLIEISDQEAGKHSGLEFLGKCLGIKDQEMAAIGNDKNDIDMMRYAGIGIAVVNASEECLQAADWIVNSNNNNGMKEVANLIFTQKAHDIMLSYQESMEEINTAVKSLERKCRHEQSEKPLQSGTAAAGDHPAAAVCSL